MHSISPPEPRFDMTDLRYPVGRFVRRADSAAVDRTGWIEDIRSAPGQLRDALRGLDDSRLDTPYREGGWTVRQVVHHLPDSHMNAYIRFRLTLTEEEPTIRPYAEALWAELPDASSAPIDISLDLLDALHRRLVLLLESLGPADWGRRLRHPENGVLDLDTLLQMYAWHGRHHVAHITGLRERMEWG
jgi:hypothetical protein